MAHLYTVGYEGLDIDEFISGLKDAGIDYLADVRKNPASRKFGFSKKRLAEKCEEAGIEYAHFPSLGVPSDWRKRAKAKIITREKMFKDYVKKILPEHPEQIEELLSLMKKHNLVLLCYEADESDCHRHFIVEEMKKRKRIKVVNLLLKQEGPRLFKSNLKSVSQIT